MNTLLAIASNALLASLSLVGVAIGVFYRRKFGESTRGWLLAVGAGLGFAGALASSMPGAFRWFGDVVALVGAIFLALGVFWLWFTMMGPDK